MSAQNIPAMIGELRKQWKTFKSPISRRILDAGKVGHTAEISSLLREHPPTGPMVAIWDISLGAAIENGNVTAVELMWDSGVSGTTQILSPLMLAAAKGQLEVVTALLGRGSPPNSQLPYGWTAVMFAAKHGHLAVTRALVGAGADVDRVTERGDTAVTLALKNGHREIAEYLSQNA